MATDRISPPGSGINFLGAFEHLEAQLQLHHGREVLKETTSIITCLRGELAL